MMSGTGAVMQWRVLGSRSEAKILLESEIERFREQFYIFAKCEQHKVLCMTKKAHKLHMQEEHAY